MHRTVSRILPFILLPFTCLTAVMIWKSAAIEQEMVKDHATLSDIRFGILNVDQWKAIAADIIEKKVQAIADDRQDKEALKQQLQLLLEELISKQRERYFEDKSSSLMGLIQGSVASITGIFDKIEEDIPEIAEDLVNFLETPENREELKKRILSAIDKHVDKAVGMTDYSIVDAILVKYGQVTETPDISTRLALMTSCTLKMESGLNNVKSRGRLWNGMGILLWILTMLHLLLPSNLVNHLRWHVALALPWLLLGITLPLILIHASISEFSFSILGHPVSFSNQTLFHESKSILEVIQLLIKESNQIEVQIAGILILAFSVILPLIKLCGIAIWNTPPNGEYEGWTNINWWRHLLIHRTSKWSMADVMVVAILLGYLGFEGILSAQMSRLEDIGGGVEAIPHPETQLAAGFYAFLGYALIGIVLSIKAEQDWGPQTKDPQKSLLTR